MNLCGSSKTKFPFAMLVVMTALALSAFADGGAVRLREATGPFLLTVFTTPPTPRTGLVDVSVLVQSRDAGETLLDAEVDLFFFSPPGVVAVGREVFCAPDGTQILALSAGDTRSRAIPATQKHATNKLLYAAKVNLPVGGDWQLRVQVRRSSAIANVNFPLPVATGGASFTNVWPFVAPPLILIAIFICHQRLQRRTLQIIPNAA
jgi:hypothetical protein